MAKLQTAVGRKIRKIKRRRTPDESEHGSGAALNATGVGMLQQSFGNRAVQRLLTEDNSKTDPQATEVQRQEEDESSTSNEEEASSESAVETEDVVEETTEENLPKVLSDPDLLEEFKVSDRLEDLESDFRGNVEEFIEVLEDGGAGVTILATAWPPERAYLMHFAWLIANDDIDPREVPSIEAIEFEDDAKPKVDIEWWHGSLEASKSVAQDIVDECDIAHLDEPPNILSHHVTGQAIDMKISWGGKELMLEDSLGEPFIVVGGPTDETHPDLIYLAEDFGVFHYVEIDADPVHWSVDGM